MFNIQTCSPSYECINLSSCWTTFSAKEASISAAPISKADTSESGDCFYPSLRANGLRLPTHETDDWLRKTSADSRAVVSLQIHITLHRSSDLRDSEDKMQLLQLISSASFVEHLTNHMTMLNRVVVKEKAVIRV